MDFRPIFYPETRVGGFTDIDGTIAFYKRVRSLVTPDSVVLDAGCGPGDFRTDDVAIRRDLRLLKGKCKRIIGIDVDPWGRENDALDEFRLIEGKTWPVEDNSIDVCFSDMVLEHVEDPDGFFSEASRVLKPGGFLCIRTPNANSYFGVVSRLIPNRLHGKVVSRVQDHRPEDHYYPTFYRCNTRRKLERTLVTHGFDPCVYGYEPEPSYLSFSKVFYALGVMHQKFAPNDLKVNLFAFARKAATPSSAQS